MWIQFMIKLCGYCIFFRSTKLNAGPPKVNSLMDRLSTNAPSTISKTGVSMSWHHHVCIWNASTWARLSPKSSDHNSLIVWFIELLTPRKLHILRCMGSKICMKFQRAPLKFHKKIWNHTPQNIHFNDFYFCVWFTIPLNCDVISLSETGWRLICSLKSIRHEKNDIYDDHMCL